MAFTKAGLKVLGYGFDRNFGGRNFDEVRRAFRTEKPAFHARHCTAPCAAAALRRAGAWRRYIRAQRRSGDARYAAGGAGRVARRSRRVCAFCARAPRRASARRC